MTQTIQQKGLMESRLFWSWIVIHSKYAGCSGKINSPLARRVQFKIYEGQTLAGNALTFNGTAIHTVDN